MLLIKSVKLRLKGDIMKRILFAGAALAALLGTRAFAADMELKAPPPPAAPSWTGPYIGLNGGYTWSNDPVQTTTTNVSSIPFLNGNIGGAVATQGTGTVPINSNGFMGGAQIGYNKQYNNFVLGIEYDFQGVARGSNQGTLVNVGTVAGSSCPGGCASTGTITSSRNLDFLGTVRARIGFLPTPSILPFVTGGFAYGQASTSTSITETLGYSDTPTPFGTAGSLSASALGWTAGGGVEWMFAPSWSAKVEYIYYDIGPVTNVLPNIQQFGAFGTLLETVGTSQSSMRFTGSDIRIGINYHFGGP